ncbi:MAG: VOC family protein [Pseudonocardiales bacterium]
MLIAPDGSLGLLFISVPEGKAVKNRIHLDLVSADLTRDARSTVFAGSALPW